MEASVATRPFAGIGRHLSHSQVSTFDRCQLAWWFRYVRGIDKPPSIPMLLGSAYHKALALNFTQKRITGEDLPTAEVVLSFEDTFNAAVRDGKVEVPYGVDPNSYRDPVSRLLDFYYNEHVVGKLEPILVEHEMVCPIPGCNYVFAGIMDLQLSDGTVIDFKVTGRRWSPAESADNTQATAYALLYGYQTPFEFHIGLRANKNPAVQIVRADRTKEDVDAYVLHLQESVAGMRDLEEGRTDPVPRTGFCNEKMCQYYGECQDFKYGPM